MERSKFIIDGWLLTLDESSLVVLLDECDWDRALHTAHDLPGWVFGSPYAIWMTVGEEPIRHRAFEGERIRHQMLASLQNVAFSKAG